MHNSIKQKVLDSTDIVDVINDYVSLTRKGKDFVGLCPFHPDRKPSMQVSREKKIFKCFACGAGGDVLKFVQMRERVDFREALAILARRAGISLTVSEADRRADRLREQIQQAVVWARSHFQRNLHDTPEGKKALDYALGRGLTRETIQRHGLGLATDAWDDLLRAAARAGIPQEVLHQAGLITTNEKGKSYDRFRHRLMFPISDALGRSVAFGGRTLGDDPAKYLNSPETSLFSKSRVLFGLDLARQSIEQRGEAVVVEGYTDAVLLHQFGFAHAVATLGTALTDAHAKLLKQRADRVILCFDGDQAGTRAADRAVEVSCLGGIDVRVAVLEAGMDPADCVLARGAAGFEAALRSAVDALEFKWSLTLKALGAEGPRARRAAVESLLEFVAGVIGGGGTNPLEQGLLVRRLSELLALPTDAVYQMLSAAPRRERPKVSPETADLPDTSSYGESIRGLPKGLVAAVEEIFGLLLADAGCARWLEGHLAQAVSGCEVWGRLSAVIQELVKGPDEYTRADVIGRCEDAELCELVSQACRRVEGTAATKEVFLAARERLASELEMLRMGELRRSLSEGEAGPSRGDGAFGDLLEAARRQHFALAAQTRWNASSAK